MKIIFPMAGLGTRFKKVAEQNPEYQKPKPFISVRGFPMIRWASASLPFLEHPGRKVKNKNRVKPADVTFVILKEHDTEHGLETKLKEIYSDEIHVVKLDKLTRGAAETAYSARDFIDPEDDLIISDSDHFFDGSFLAKLIETKGPDTAGIIPVFRARNEGIPKWSYTLTKPGSDYAEKVAEKDRELMEAGAYANIGAYYFSKGKHFMDLAEEIIRKNKTFGAPGKGEFYIAPLFQELIAKGLKVQVAVIPEVWGLGTPEDLEYFLKNCPINKI